MTWTDLSIAFLLGLAASIHCVQMCGPLVISWSASSSSLSGHLLYHAGRMVTYALLGAFAGWLGRGVSQIAKWESAASLLAGALMLLAGLLMIGALRRPSLIQIAPARSFTRRAAALIASPALAAKLRLGALMGFLPCGLVYAALLKAMAPADPLAGALSMAAFGFGTAGPLILLGACSSFLARPLAPYGAKVAAVSVTAIGALLIFRGLMPVTGIGHAHPH